MTNTIYTKVTNTKTFIQKANIVHNNRYSYPNTVYTNTEGKLEIECSVHGSFWQTAVGHLKGRNCIKCGGTAQPTTKEFIQKANIVHNGLYSYPNTVYTKTKEKVEIECSVHGSFCQTPTGHLSGKGCRYCDKTQKIDTVIFIERANITHNYKYTYPNAVYTKSCHKVEIECGEHGAFNQNANNHISGAGCPRCSMRQYSKIAIRWLDSIGLDIQHAENGGEYRLPNSRYFVDGYCKNTNTIYEFHGDVYHGNPKLYKLEDNCHPFNKDITARELYQNTIERENEIKSLGYNLVVMWENEFRLATRFT